MNLVHLDLLLNHFYHLKDYSLFSEVHSSFNSVHEISSRDLLILINKLEKDGYIIRKPSTRVTTNLNTKEQNESQAILFFISFEGVVFLESAPFIWKHRPYKWKEMKEIANTIWTVLKIIMIALNAVAIIYLTYLQTQKS